MPSVYTRLRARLTPTGQVFYDNADGSTVLELDSVAGVSSGAPMAFSGKATLSSVVGLGAAETPTIASGVLTVTKSHVNPLPESSTSDTVDSIVLSGQAAGDLLLIHVPATNTITFDNSATMLLGAATRAVAPGGSLLLIAVSATVWHEVSFLAATS